jgi:hypothetical protein
MLASDFGLPFTNAVPLGAPMSSKRGVSGCNLRSWPGVISMSVATANQRRLWLASGRGGPGWDEAHGTEHGGTEL